jgi:two-component system, OmpR family, response regulator
MEPMILLVEPDAMTRGLLAEVLEHAGYAVITTACGHEAIALLKEAAWDIVLTELELPDEMGVTLLAAVKQQIDIPVVIVQSACATFDSALAALKAGAVDYLRKPYAPSDVLASIETVLARRQQLRGRRTALATIAAATVQLCEEEPTGTSGTAGSIVPPPASQEQNDTQVVLRVGQLTIDRLRHKVCFAGASIPVTPTQFKLLCCLGERAGQMVSGAEIVQYTHGLCISNDEAQLLLKSHVRNLRRRIDPAYLHNTRSLGYCLAPPEAPQRISSAET